MSTARTADAAPLGLVQVGAIYQPCQSIAGRAETPVKPRSELAHQPGQQPAAFSCEWCGDPIPADLPDDDFCSDACHWEWSEQAGDDEW